MRRFPSLPVEEEGRLADPGIREDFIARVFEYMPVGKAALNPLPLVPAEPNVFEDYFSLGTIPAELCARHSVVADTASGTSGAVSTSGVAPASFSTPAVVIERDLRSDATTALTIKRSGG